LDWALITQTMERFETLDAGETLAELASLKELDPELADEIDRLRGQRDGALSFMQTSAPGALADTQANYKPGDIIGVWRVEQRLGAGGMGEVYRAQRCDGLFEQQVALKIAKTKTDLFRTRFETERQRLAQLEHPNIARIIDGGTADNGSPYLTMEYVDGLPIDRYAEEWRLDRRRRLGLIQKLCAAGAHAHGRLILHRDIKPDNVLVNADGELRLIDFGIASLLDDADESHGGGPLTLAYAAPEQLKGETVSAATDIFGIGALAHFLEAGALPTRQPDGGVAIDAAALGDNDLVAILAKATADDPSQRYASADAFGADLERLTNGFPVQARPVSMVTKFTKLIARNRLASTMSAAAIAAVIVGVIGVSVFAIRASEEAEANRIAQQKGAATIEINETFNAGFNRWYASIDPQSAEGEAVATSLAGLEASAQSFEKDEPRQAFESYVFLAELYADTGRDQDASRIAGKLFDGDFEMGYPLAYTSLGLLQLSQGFVEQDKILAMSGRLDEFFASDPSTYGFSLTMNRCVRSQMSKEQDDQQACLDSAAAHLSEIDQAEYAVMSGNLPLFLFAAEAASELERFDTAIQFAKGGLNFYANETRPGSVPEALFWVALSDIAQLQENWALSKDNLQSARASLEGEMELGWLELSLSMELAQSYTGLEEFDKAEAAARDAAQRARRDFGEDHFRVRDADAQVAIAVAAQGDKATAIAMLETIITAEENAGAEPNSLKNYRAMLAEVTGA